MTRQITDILEVISKVLLRCWLFGFVLLFIWLGVDLFLGESIVSIHAQVFGLTGHELQVIFYCGMGLTKVLVLLFFFIPWLAVKLVIRTSSTTTNDQ